MKLYVDKKQASVVDYLNQKYSEDLFTFGEEFGGELFGANSQSKYLCYSNNYPSIPITVIYDKYTQEYFDNYIDVKYSDEVDKLIDSVLTESMQGLYYYSIPFGEIIDDGNVNEIDSNVSFEQYLAERGVTIIAFVDCASEEATSSVKKNLESIIESKGVYFELIDIYFLDNYDTLLETDDSKQSSIITNGKYLKHLTIKMDNNSQIRDSYWEK